MKVATILKAKGDKVVTVHPDATIATVIQSMKLEGVGAVIVSADAVTLEGLISERDIVLGLGQHGGEVLAMLARELMNRSAATCTPESDIKEVMAEMTRRRTRHLPVVERGSLCGMVSIGDVVKNRLEEAQMEIDVLRDAYIASH
ncbi:MAG: CBS domain-containing protein [Alphaproteobacteria bacterium]